MNALLGQQVTPPDNIRLRPAEVNDFTEGNIIYVRGRRVVCKRLEYPLVYWAVEGSDIEKHRSFVADAALFKVEDTRPAGSGDQANASSDTKDSGGGQNKPGAESKDSKTETKKAEAPKKDKAWDDHPSPAAAKDNLISAFQKRTPKTEYRNLTGQEIRCDTKHPGGVHIEVCENCTITVPEKVSSITLSNCTKVKVHFSTVISNFEFIRATDCEATCTGQAASWTIDASKGCKISLPRKEAAQGLMLVSSQSAGTAITLKGDPEAKNDDAKDLAYEIQYPAESTDVKDNKAATTPATTTPATGDGAGAAAASAAPQYHTKFAGGAFTTTKLVREGIGYVPNN